MITINLQNKHSRSIYFPTTTHYHVIIDSCTSIQLLHNDNEISIVLSIHKPSFDHKKLWKVNMDTFLILMKKSSDSDILMKAASQVRTCLHETRFRFKVSVCLIKLIKQALNRRSLYSDTSSFRKAVNCIRLFWDRDTPDTFYRNGLTIFQRG